MSAAAQQLARLVASVLDDSLLSPKFRKIRRYHSETRSRLFGHCYVASEALFHILGGEASEWRPVCARISDEVTHWWIEHPEHGVLDPTAEQFVNPRDIYPKGRRCGFLTKRPSRRAEEVLLRVRKRIADLC